MSSGLDRCSDRHIVTGPLSGVSMLGESPMSIEPFHLSVPVKDLASARAFYGDLLGCKEGRSAEKRIDFNFFGHHLVTHVEPTDASHRTTTIDSAGVPTPCRHFGVVISADEWNKMADRLKAAKADFFTE